MAPERITLKDPARFRGPRKSDVGALHRAPGPRARAVSRRARGHPAGSAGIQDGESPLRGARHQSNSPTTTSPELSATHYVATAAANAPSTSSRVLPLPARRRAAPPRDGPGRVRAGRHSPSETGSRHGSSRAPRADSSGTCWSSRTPSRILVKANFVAEGAAGPATFAVLADGAEARGDMLSAVNHRARVRDETRHISYARALVRALIEEDAANLDVIQRWQDESLRLFAEVAHGGRRREWWAGFLDSYYKIALPWACARRRSRSDEAARPRPSSPEGGRWRRQRRGTAREIAGHSRSPRR